MDAIRKITRKVLSIIRFDRTNRPSTRSYPHSAAPAFEECEVCPYLAGRPVSEGNSFLDAVIEHLPSMVFVKDAKDLRFVRFNKAGEEMLGINRDELLGKNDYDLFPREQAEFFTGKDREVLNGTKPLEIPIETITTRNNGVRFLATKKVAIRDLAGEPLYLLGISEDITETKIAQDELKLARAELEQRVELRTRELNRANEELKREIQERKEIEASQQSLTDRLESLLKSKDQFLAELSHELRAPLTPVLLSLAKLEKDARLPSACKGEISLMADSLRLEVRLIDDLLDLTKIRKGKLELHEEVPELSKLLLLSYKLSTPEAQMKGVRLVIGHLDNNETWVKGDAARLQQVFLNLIRNAVKFTQPGGVVELSVSSNAQGDVEVTVSDNGVGLEPSNIERLFKAYEQGGEGITRRFGGLGLGLSISKAIVDRHGGTIRAQSDGIGRGATFTVSLPTVAAPIYRELKSHENQGTRRARSCILLVEDDLLSAELIAGASSGAGHTVKKARSVKDALSCLEQESFDLLISDVGLPDGTAYDILASPSFQALPHAIALSGYGSEEDKRKSIEAGFDQHIVKPVEVEVLLRTVEEIAHSNVSSARHREFPTIKNLH